MSRGAPKRSGDSKKPDLVSGFSANRCRFNSGGLMRWPLDALVGVVELLVAGLLMSDVSDRGRPESALVGPTRAALTFLGIRAGQLALCHKSGVIP